jgi:hypothetical protein
MKVRDTNQLLHNAVSLSPLAVIQPLTAKAVTVSREQGCVVNVKFCFFFVVDGYVKCWTAI